MPIANDDDNRFNFFRLIQFLILLLIVPVQYFLTRSSSESLRHYELDVAFTRLRAFGLSVLNASSWMNWCLDKIFLDNNAAIIDDKSAVPAPDSDSDSSTTVSNKATDKHFGLSHEPRLVRPPSVLYKVGQVIQHKEKKFKGVIIGWDEKASAPTYWLKKYRPRNDTKLNDQPNYATLIDSRTFSTIPQVAYIVQENIELVSRIRVYHPLIDNYFEDFDGERYRMRPWLKKVYPHDEY